MQHIRRGFPIEGPILSDHLPLLADFNRPAPRCSMRPRMAGDPVLLPGDDPNPFGPQRVFFDVGNPGSPTFKEISYASPDPDTGITYPGSVQWYVIDQPYPYMISTGPAGGSQVTVAYEVYQARDLSTPMPAYEGECEVSNRRRQCLYLLSDPPYYIKVFAAYGANPTTPNRSDTGGYGITFKRYDCSSKEEACPLEVGIVYGPGPGERQWLNGPYLWPQGQQLDPNAPSDTMWFRFETLFPLSGPDATLVSVLHDYPQQKEDPDGSLIDFFTIKYHKKNGVELSAQHDYTPEPPDWASEPPGQNPPEPLWRRSAVVSPSSLPGLTEGRGVQETYLISVTRDSNYIDLQTYTWVELFRGLTWFRPKTMSCILERTWVGMDDIASDFSFGGYNDGLRQLGDIGGDFETWDGGSNMQQYGTPGAVRSTWPPQLDATLGENDGVSTLLYEDVIDGDNFLLSKWGADPVEALAPDRPGWEGIESAIMWTNDLDLEDADYRYKMTYKLSHRPMPPRGVGDCGPHRAYNDFNTGEFRCACINNQACNRDQNSALTGQTCDIARGKCVYP